MKLPKSWTTRIGVTLVLLMGILVPLAGLALVPLSKWKPALDPNAEQLTEQNLPPLTDGHLLGTDDHGRDVFLRILAGGKRTFFVGILAIAIAALFGIPIGAAAGYFSGRFDHWTMRAMEVLMAFPTLVLAIAIVSVLGPGLINVLIAVGIVGIPKFARQARAGVLVEKEKEYVLAGRAIGLGEGKLLFRTILPNCLSPLLVLGTLGVATAILEVAGLGFLGLGVEPGIPEWGADLNATRNLYRIAPWALLSPGTAIALSVLGLNLLGDAMQDTLRRNSS